MTNQTEENSLEIPNEASMTVEEVEEITLEAYEYPEPEYPAHFTKEFIEYLDNDIPF